MLSLGQIDQSHRLLVGGKAANLGTLVQAGLPVPNGFCLTTSAFQQFVAANPKLQELTSRLAEGSFALPELAAGRADLQVCPSKVQDSHARPKPEAEASLEPIPKLVLAIRSNSAKFIFPENVQTALVAAWRQCGQDAAYAVRSSATVEDAEEHSFAGQFESILEVKGKEALLKAVQACWLSLFSERALAYQLKHRLPLAKAAMAVVVQIMVDAERSGVVFTADPVNGNRDRFIVEHTAGLGEAVVSGTICPQRIEVDKAGHPVDSAAVAEPRTRLESSQSDTGKESQPILSEAVLNQLLHLCGQVERLFGMPQDIEWAQRNGEILLLQARPISAFGAPDLTPSEVWSNLNVKENFPNVATPMTWSLLEYCLRRFFAPIFIIMGINIRQEPWVGLVAGRIYMNVKTLGRLMLSLPGFRWAEITPTFGGHDEPIIQQVFSNLKNQKRSLGHRLQMLGRVLCLGGWFLYRTTWQRSEVCIKWMRQAVDRYTRVSPAELPDDRLFPYLTEMWDYLFVRAPVPFMIGAGIVFNVALDRCCRKWFKDSQGVLANKLISRAGAMASAESAIDLWRLADWTIKDPQLKASALSATSFSALSHTLLKLPTGEAFLAKWNSFMAQHGHHAFGEADVATPRWSETPEVVLRLLQNYLRSADQLDLLQTLDQRQQNRDQTLSELCGQLRNPLKRFLLKVMVKRSQEWLLIRENLKCEFIRLLAYVRKFLLELGARMTRDGILESAEDVLFLKLEEIELVRAGSAPFEVRSTIQARREEFKINQELDPPPVVIGNFNSASPSPKPPAPGAKVLRGLSVSPGIVEGPARVILRSDSAESVLPGEILVAPFTDPGWTPLFLTAAGLVVDLGGQLSHGSVIAREYGLPAVVNVQFATQVIQTGQMIRVDADQGIVTVLS